LHDSLALNACVSGDERAVYADKAYDSQALRDTLEKQGIEACLMHRLRKGDKARSLKSQLNKTYSSVRSKVERTFGTFKRTYGWDRVRYIGEAKNQVFLYLVSIAFNLRRALNIELGKTKVRA
jgi:IS5 family transposase